MQSPELDALLDYLRRDCGFDFTGYKRSSLTRRITQRMRAVRIDSYAAYREYLRADRVELERLVDTILVNVTGFFRDQRCWGHVRAEIVPALLEQKGAREPVRVWSAGCATGEEAYTLAILFAEAMGAEGLLDRVRIYATDVDEEALAAARSGRFAARGVERLPGELVDRYFERTGASLTFRKDLRRALVFGRHDLIRDVPISRVDLLTCRNVLMYFDAATQSRIVEHFSFALDPGGYLVLGTAETLPSHAETFAEADRERRIFRKVAAGPAAPARPPGPWLDGGHPAEQLELARAMLAAAYDRIDALTSALEAAEAEVAAASHELRTMNAELQSTIAAAPAARRPTRAAAAGEARTSTPSRPSSRR